MISRVLALDIGGSKLAVAVVSSGGEMLAARTSPTPASSPPVGVLDLLFQMAEEATQEAGLSQEELAAVGISFGGPVDYPAGLTLTCHHLLGWEEFPLRETVAARAGLPTAMDNDANAAALGEAVFGAGRGCRHVLYLTVSTGIGAGLVLDGRVHRGAHSAAGELGHTTVVPDGPVCPCGRRGCLEAVASGPAIARAAREALAEGRASSLSSIPADRITARAVAEAAPNDSLAASLLACAGEHLGFAISCAANLLDPDVVVIGGGVSRAGELLLAPLRASLLRHVVPQIGDHLRVAPAGLGDYAPLMGAAALALQLPLS